MIRNSPTKSILSNSQHSTPQRTVCLDHPLNQQQQHDSPNKGQTYHTMPNRKVSDSPQHQLIQIQQQSNIDNDIVTLQAPINANNLFYPVVNRFPYQYHQPRPTSQSPPAFFVQNDNNCEYYLATTAQPLFVAKSNICQAASGSPQHHSQQPQQQQQQPAYHLIHLTNPNQANLLNKSQCNSNQQAMHIKQIHTATVHGKQIGIGIGFGRPQQKK